MDSRRREVAWGVLAVLAAAVVLGCSPRADEGGGVQDGPKYREVTVTRGPFRIVVSANGLVQPIDRIELKSKASGAVVELPIEAGQAVAKGDLIAKLDQVEERADLAQARADLDIAKAEFALAEKNFARRQQLFTSDVISMEVQDETELALAVARGKLVGATTALERAEERMADSVIAAPVDGIILQKYVEKGQIIASGVSNVGGGTPIADIANLRNVYVEAGIDEIDIGKIEVGQQAFVHAEAYPDQLYHGEVVRIAPEARVEQNVTLFDVVVYVENTDARLKPGMNSSISIEIVNEPELLLIPVAALQERDGSGPAVAGGPATAVVLVAGAGGYEPREIETGRTNYSVVEVLGGLDEGDVLGIPMRSRLKEEHDRIDARFRGQQGFGASSSSERKPASGGR